jgi:hypothetical protein
MNTKSVYQLNEEGYLLGQTIAFESPLEPGVFHIPRGCVDTDKELPELKHFDDRIKWSVTEWIVCNERIEKEKQTEFEKQEEERLRLEEILKIEDEKKRQKELQKLEKEKQRQTLLNKKNELENKLNNFKELEHLEKQIEENNKLSNLSQGECDQIQAQIAQLKNTIICQH